MIIDSPKTTIELKSKPEKTFSIEEARIYSKKIISKLASSRLTKTASPKST